MKALMEKAMVLVLCFSSATSVYAQNVIGEIFKEVVQSAVYTAVNTVQATLDTEQLGVKWSGVHIEVDNLTNFSGRPTIYESEGPCLGPSDTGLDVAHFLLNSPQLPVIMRFYEGRNCEGRFIGAAAQVQGVDIHQASVVFPFHTEEIQTPDGRGLVTPSYLVEPAAYSNPHTVSLNIPWKVWNSTLVIPVVNVTKFTLRRKSQGRALPGEIRPGEIDYHEFAAIPSDTSDRSVTLTYDVLDGNRYHGSFQIQASVPDGAVAANPVLITPGYVRLP